MAFHTEMLMDVQGRWVKLCPLRSKWEGFWVYDFNWKKDSESRTWTQMFEQENIVAG